jgi:hypothetical protein
MTPSLSRPPSRRAAAALVLTGLLAGCASTAVSSEQRAPATGHAPRVAVLAGPDASATAVADATSGRSPRVVRRVGGLLEAQAQAAALAAQGYDVVIGLGPQARSAVAQARAAEVGPHTSWRAGSAS